MMGDEVFLQTARGRPIRTVRFASTVEDKQIVENGDTDVCSVQSVGATPLAGRSEPPSVRKTENEDADDRW